MSLCANFNFKFLSYLHTTLITCHRQYSSSVFYWRYNPLWILAFSVILFHSTLSLHNFLQPLIPILCISSSMSLIHLFLGLPLFLLPTDFHFSTLLGIHFLPSASRDPAKPSFLQILLCLRFLLGRSARNLF